MEYIKLQVGCLSFLFLIIHLFIIREYIIQYFSKITISTFTPVSKAAPDTKNRQNRLIFGKKLQKVLTKKQICAII